MGDNTEVLNKLDEISTQIDNIDISGVFRSAVPQLIAQSIESHTARTFDVSNRSLYSKYTKDNFYLVATGIGYGPHSELNNLLDKSYEPSTGILSVTTAVNHYNANNGFWLIYDVYLIDAVLEL